MKVLRYSRGDYLISETGDAALGLTITYPESYGCKSHESLVLKYVYWFLEREFGDKI